MNHNYKCINLGPAVIDSLWRLTINLKLVCELLGIY